MTLAGALALCFTYGRPYIETWEARQREEAAAAVAQLGRAVKHLKPEHFNLWQTLDHVGQAIERRAVRAARRATLTVETYRPVRGVYEVEPDLTTCRAGRLTQATKTRALTAANQIRALHHLPPVRYSSRYDEQMQAAALIQAAAGYPGHDPAPSARCYTAAGAEGSGTSNLYGGSGWNEDPVSHMVGWANDAHNASLVAAAGHRRWLLNPFAVHLSYGQVQGYAVQKVFRFEGESASRPRIAVDYVAFPYETYPFHLVEDDPPWSFSVIEDKTSRGGNQHPYFAHATVRVTRVEDGTRLAVSRRYTDTEWIGVPNFLSWQVANWEYDTLYQVEIANVVMQSGAARTFAYPVLIY